jgi:TM2 domain-containing membrane protein YozV
MNTTILEIIVYSLSISFSGYLLYKYIKSHKEDNEYANGLKHSH